MLKMREWVEMEGISNLGRVVGIDAGVGQEWQWHGHWYSCCHRLGPVHLLHAPPMFSDPLQPSHHHCCHPVCLCHYPHC